MSLLKNENIQHSPQSIQLQNEPVQIQVESVRLNPDASSLGFSHFEMGERWILPKPNDIADSEIGYNPSGIWTIPTGKYEGLDFLYKRVEPNRANEFTSHLGKSVCRPYLIDVTNPSAPLELFHGAAEYRGEDPSLTRIFRRLLSGKLEEIWLLSVVDPKPRADKPNEVESLVTRFYAGTDLKELEHIADGPLGMKDIPVCRAEGKFGTEIDVYGRPQPAPYSGNISHVRLNSIEELNAERIAEAEVIDPSLAVTGSGIWIGIKDAINIGNGKRLLPGHRAWRTGPENKGKHYEGVLYGHNTVTGKIVDLGVFALAEMFAGERIVKDDESADTHDVVFPGGGYNGTFTHMTYGIGDGCSGVSEIRLRAA